MLQKKSAVAGVHGERDKKVKHRRGLGCEILPCDNGRYLAPCISKFIELHKAKSEPKHMQINKKYSGEQEILEKNAGYDKKKSNCITSI